MSECGKLHTFRHSFISKTLAKGIPNATVRSWVGHVSDEMLRRYTHVLEQDSRAGIECFFPQRLQAAVVCRQTM